MRSLYLEAVATLEEQALGACAAVRSRRFRPSWPRSTGLLTELKREVEKPFAPLDESSFLLALGERNPDLSNEEVTALETLVEDLTTPCRQCHRVENATIARVQAGQDALRRAEFDHRAHILQARCLDCHAEIPILENLGAETEADRELSTTPRSRTCPQSRTVGSATLPGWLRIVASPAICFIPTRAGARSCSCIWTRRHESQADFPRARRVCLSSRASDDRPRAEATVVLDAR